jgi:hypothetical protein
MKNIFALLSIAFIFNFNANAQTFDEWFQQKKTQKKYLVQQIAALKVYLGYAKKGYEIAQRGWTTVENIKGGNFNLDRDFFRSLKNVNPAIKNMAKVADIIAFQYFIIKDFKRIYKFCENNKNFRPEELRYIAKVHTNMLFLCDASISELLNIITADKTEMTDDERIIRINRIYEDMSDKCAFVKDFGNDAKALSVEREKEIWEIELLKKNNAI